MSIKRSSKSNKLAAFLWVISAIVILGTLTYATTISESTSIFTGDVDLNGKRLLNASNLGFSGLLDNSLVVFLSFDESGLTTNKSIAYNSIRSQMNGTLMNNSVQ